MQILHVCSRFTPRPLKLIMAQQAEGHSVQLLYLQDCQPEMFPYVMYPTRYNNTQQFNQKLQMFSAIADLIWVHTCIDNVTLIDHTIKALGKSKVKVAWDIHDFVADQMTLERCSLPDYIITPSMTMVRQVYDIHPLIDVRLIYNKCPKALDCEGPVRIPNSVVLASGLEAPGGTVWRDYTQTEQKLKEEGRSLFIYSANSDTRLAEHYDFIMMRLPLGRLIKTMSNYGHGWAGAANDKHNIDVCVTNKFWEYLAAGIPVLTFNSKEMSDIIEMLGVYDRNDVREAKRRGDVFLEDDLGYQGFMAEVSR